jgi:hypothetical protein
MSFRALESPEPVRRYLHLKAELRRLTDEMKALEPEVWDAVDEEGGAADFAGSRLESFVARTYRYSEAVEAAEAELRAMKEAERRAGTAVLTRATGFVRVSEPKGTGAEAEAAMAAAARTDARAALAEAA